MTTGGESLEEELAERLRAGLDGGDAEGAELLQERAGGKGGRAWQGADFTTDQLAMRHAYPDARTRLSPLTGSTSRWPHSCRRSSRPASSSATGQDGPVPRKTKKAGDFPARKPAEPSITNITRRIEFHLLYPWQVT